MMTAHTTPRAGEAQRRGPYRLALTSILLFVATLGWCHQTGRAVAAEHRAAVVSSRPEHVSGGDALVEVSGSLAASIPTFESNGVAVEAELRTSSSDGKTKRFLVKGLALGAQVLTVSSRAGSVRLPLTNHPVTGPVLSGPHLRPYECRTVENGLGPPLDHNCSAERTVGYYYKSVGGAFKPLSLRATSHPSDLATTTVLDGRRVPYIVRVESGTINRGVYRIATLADPVGAAGGTFRDFWNGRLIVGFGCCGSAQYNQGLAVIDARSSDGIAPYVLRDRELALGYAVMISSELVNNQHANPHLQGETLMMLKEYFIERYGVPRWTLGYGYSGGAIQQYLIAQLFPGLLDGIQAGLSFPETIMPAVADCRLLRRVFAADPRRWSAGKQEAVEGFLPGVCAVWDQVFATPLMVAGDRARDTQFGCGLRDRSKAYDPQRNPGGARCSIFDTNVNLLGRDPKTGFARRPFDNVGVQYGLLALRAGKITVDDFLSLNEKIGGFDADGEHQEARMVADPIALANSYGGGLINSFAGDLGRIPVIAYRNNAGAPNDIHDRMQDHVIRARIVRAHGRHDNHVVLTSGIGNGVDLEGIVLDIATRWLDAISRDPGKAGIERTVRNKPADAVDGCWRGDGRRLPEPLTLDPRSACNAAFPLASGPRLVAGQSLANDVLKCRLGPIRLSGYPAALDPEQQRRLNRIFAGGVCDYVLPGAGQRLPLGTYLSLPLRLPAPEPAAGNGAPAT